MTAHCDFCGNTVADDAVVHVVVALHTVKHGMARQLPIGPVFRKTACSSSCAERFTHAISADVLISKHFLETGWLLEIEDLKTENNELRSTLKALKKVIAAAMRGDAAQQQEPAATSAGDLPSESRASAKPASSGRREAVSGRFARSGKAKTFPRGGGVQSSLARSDLGGEGKADVAAPTRVSPDDAHPIRTVRRGRR